jgi:hypothetical protein
MMATFSHEISAGNRARRLCYVRNLGTFSREMISGKTASSPHYSLLWVAGGGAGQQRPVSIG